ncbi:glycosyltransferase [Desulfosporosinus sp. SB140]|uniref:glycosyltransferase n=1 Tax=Desulfosporosinus paludis TaxID=3115649 RepID=UPI003890731E
MSVKISLCMIVKNEQENIRRCLQSAVNYVDEIIVVDTGSTDNTCEIAQTFGAKIYSFPWDNNFGAARNASLEQAKGDWILFLDADEELQMEHPHVLRDLASSKHEGFFIKIINYIGKENWVETSPDLVFRLFRNKPEYRFEGAVHEQIVDKLLLNNPQASFQIVSGLSILHYGYLEQQIRDKDKKNRNLKLIEEELKQKPNDSLLLYHYGVELFRAEKFSDAALVFIKTANATKPETIYFPKLIRYLVMSQQSAKEYLQALHALDLGLQFFPDYADLYYYKGLIHLERKNFALAQEAFQKAVSMPEQPLQYASFGGVRGFRSYYHLGNIYEHFLDEEEALNYYILSLRDNPEFKHSLERIISILNPAKYPEDTKESLEKVFTFCSPQAQLMLAEIYLKHESYKLCLEQLEKIEDPIPQNNLWKIICQIQEKKHFSALRALANYSSDNLSYPLAKLNELISYWVQNKKQKSLGLIMELKNLKLSVETGNVIDLIYLNITNMSTFAYKFTAEGWSLLQDILKRLIYLKEIEKVQDLLSKIDLKSADEQIIFELARSLQNQGYSRMAKESLSSLSEIKDPETYYLLGEVGLELKNYQEAENYYLQAIHLAEDEPKYYVKLGILYQIWHSDLLNEALERYPEEEMFRSLAGRSEC